MPDVVVVSPPPNTLTVSSPGTQGPPGGGSATGTGFVHVTGGVVDAAARAVDLSTADVTGVLPDAKQAAQTLGGDLTGTTSAAVVRFLTGTAGVVALTDGSALHLSSTGTHPAAGLIKVKSYGSDTVVVGWRHAGGDSYIMKTNGASQRLTIGDNLVTVGTDLVLQAYYGMILQTAASAMLFYAAGAGFQFAHYSTGNKNLTIPIAVAGAAANMMFGENVIAKIGQDQAVTNTNGTALSVVAQAAKSGAGGNGGTLALASGAKDGAGTDGSVTISCGTALQVTVTAFQWLFTGSTQLTSAGDLYLGDGVLGFYRSAGTGLVAVRLSSGGLGFVLGSNVQSYLTFKGTNASVSSMEVDSAVTAFTIKQNDLTTASGTGAAFTIQAQNETGATSTGGILALKPGTGTTVDGQLQLGTSKCNIVATGAWRTTQRAIAGNLTVDTTTTDYEILVDTGGARTVTLPTPTAGRKLLVKDKTGQAATNNITIAPSGAEKIEGVAGNFLINWNWGWVILSSDGTDWFVYS